MDDPVLVVEGDDDIRATVAELLEAESYPVVAVADAVAALRWMGMRRPALVVVNGRLPELSCQQLIALMRARDTGCDVPIVVYAASPTKIAGADAQLPMPFEVNALLDTVAALLRPAGEGRGDSAEH